MVISVGYPLRDWSSIFTVCRITDIRLKHFVS